jgi:hypothetical protein
MLPLVGKEHFSPRFNRKTDPIHTEINQSDFKETFRPSLFAINLLDQTSRNHHSFDKRHSNMLSNMKVTHK